MRLFRRLLKFFLSFCVCATFVWFLKGFFYREYIPFSRPFFSEDGNLVYVSVRNKVGFSFVYQINLRQNTLTKVFSEYGVINGVLNSLEGAIFYSVSNGRNSRIRIFDHLKNKQKNTLLKKKNTIFNLAIFLPNQDTILLTSVNWIDTHSLFVGYTISDRMVSSFHVSSKKMRLLFKSGDLTQFVSYRSSDPSFIFDQYTKNARFNLFLYDEATSSETRVLGDRDISNWHYDPREDRVYFVSEGFVYWYGFKEKTEKGMFEMNKSVDFLVKHPTQNKFLIKFSADPKTLIYMDEFGNPIQRFSI